MQPVARGTGDAAATGLAALGDFDGDVLVLPGDGALLTAATLQRLVETHRAEGAAVTLLTVETDEPLRTAASSATPPGRSPAWSRSATPPTRSARSAS